MNGMCTASDIGVISGVWMECLIECEMVDGQSRPLLPTVRKRRKIVGVSRGIECTLFHSHTLASHRLVSGAALLIGIREEKLVVRDN